MKIMSVVGARPQFVKLGPIASACKRSHEIEHLIVHTGQHYDPLLSDVFFNDLGIPEPDAHLGVGSATHGRQTGAMLAAMDDVLEQLAPDCVLVYGDTNSTTAAALAAVKMHIPVAHLEAGLRSFNRQMPEEHNRVVTDHLADLLLAPTQTAAAHLARENLADRTVVVGDVMTDVCFATRDAVREHTLELPSGIDPTAPYVLATIHRAENTDQPERLTDIVTCLQQAPTPVLLLVHPRVEAIAAEANLALTGGNLFAVPPRAYPDMVRTILGSSGVVTDSGGLQKEAYLLGVPTTTLRTETEWVETLQDGWNVLDPDLARVHELMARSAPDAPRSSPYGDGTAAPRSIEAIVEAFS